MANPETLLGEIEAKTRELLGTVMEGKWMFFSQSLKVSRSLMSALFTCSQKDNATIGVHQKQENRETSMNESSNNSFHRNVMNLPHVMRFPP